MNYSTKCAKWNNIAIILGDFNARVYTIEGPAAATVFGRYHFDRGADVDQAEIALQNTSIGITDNRARMIELATTHKMVAMNAQFRSHNSERITYKCLGTKWYHPIIGDRYEQMDYFLIKTRWRNMFKWCGSLTHYDLHTIRPCQRAN